MDISGTVLAMNNSPWMTRGEVAQRLRISTKTVDRWAGAGRLTAYTVEGSRGVRYKRSEVDGLFSPRTAEDEPEPVKPAA